MKICLNCQLEYDDKFAFCKKCGTKLETKEEEKICPNCMKEDKTDGVFCPYCGSILDRNKSDVLSVQHNNAVNVNAQQSKENNNSYISDHEVINEKEKKKGFLSDNPGCLMVLIVLAIVILTILAICLKDLGFL